MTNHLRRCAVRPLAPAAGYSGAERVVTPDDRAVRLGRSEARRPCRPSCTTSSILEPVSPLGVAAGEVASLDRGYRPDERDELGDGGPNGH